MFASASRIANFCAGMRVKGEDATTNFGNESQNFGVQARNLRLLSCGAESRSGFQGGVGPDNQLLTSPNWPLNCDLNPKTWRPGLAFYVAALTPGRAGTDSLESLIPRRNMHRQVRSWGRFAVALWTLSGGMGRAWLAQAQVMSTMVEEAERAGFGFYDVSVFGTYSNARTPVIAPTGGLISDYSFHTYSTGVSATVGWRSPSSKKWHLSVVFTPSYFYNISSTGFSRSRFWPRQNLDLNWGTPLSSRWTLNTSLVATAGEYSQLLLLANPAQVLVGTPGTPGQLATAILTNTTSGAAQAILTGQQNLLFGERFLTAAATASLSYAATNRLTFTESTSVSRTQGLGGGGPQQPSLLRRSTYLNENLSASYRLGERTSVFGTLGYPRSVSSLFITPWLNVNAGLARNVTEHFSVTGSLGAGYILPSGQGPNGIGFQRGSWQASLNAGYRFFRQALVASFSRTVSDNYGLGSSGTIYARGAWHWSPLGSPWGISVGAAEMRLQGTQFGRQGYSLTASVNRSLTGRLFTSLSYGYGEGTGVASLLNPLVAHTHTQSVSLNFGFHPYFGKPDPGAFPGLPGMPGMQGVPGTQVGP